MKRHSIIALLAVALWWAGSALTPLFAQASTEGTEFWVALTLGRGPEDASQGFEPFICVSSKSRQGTVTVSNPQTNWSQTYNIPASTGWLEIKDIPQTAIYPYPANEQGQQKASGQTFKNGLLVTCDEEISVFAALRYEHAFDAANILPITALQYEYIVQDYPPYANESPTTSFSNFCILATENNTKVDITPKNKTYDGKAADSRFTVTLQRGEVYYIVSQEGTESNAEAVSLSGSHIVADKKIAVFNGDICTTTPTGISARDIHYEQAMPVDYWGREFIITRSLEKNANRYRITALEDGTQVEIDNQYFTTLNAYETCEIELAVGEMKKSTLAKNNQRISDVAYIKTSCPCAIYNYDTGNQYSPTDKDKEQITGKRGDPSMTWVSPLEQRINDITFGVMNTDMTHHHFVNIIVPTASVDGVSLQEIANGQEGANMLTASAFLPVPNTTYSYARVKLAENQNTTYRLYNKSGFIAHVYGNGENESYAYSVGSSAVKRGVNVEGETYTEGYRSETVYCVGTTLTFDAQVGTDVIDKVDWNFGDGVSEKNGPTQILHTYDSPGWYDVVANIYAHKECPETPYPAEEVRFSFYVRRPDTVEVTIQGDCYAWNYEGELIERAEQQPDDCATDDYEIQTIVHGKETRDVQETVVVAKDSFYLPEEGRWYYADFAPGGHAVITDSTVSTNAAGCKHTHVYSYDLTIQTCLEMSVSETPDTLCAEPDAAEDVLYYIPFQYVKGQIAEAYLLIDSVQIEATPDLTDATLAVPLRDLRPGVWEATIEVVDTVCEQTLRFPYHLVIYYPSNIFAMKFGNVFAVYTSYFNGGYTFKGYQWYRDGEPIEGATESIYHTTEPFPAGASYYVVLTREDGLVLPSCEQTIPGEAASQPTPAAEKILRHQQLYIRVDGTLYDVYGNVVEQ